MKIIPPLHGFVDKAPRRGPWICATTPPPAHWSAELLFADGRTGSATWVPAKPPVRPVPIWWGWCDVRRCQAILEPIGWREVERAHSC